MVIDSLLVLGGLALLVLGGELLLRGAVGLARLLGLSPLLIGLTVVACATSMPELVVTVAAGLEGRPVIGVGNVIGSNIANILLIVGAAALIQVMHPPRGLAKRDGLVMTGATLAMIVMAFAGTISWPHGLVFLLLLAAYLVASYLIETRSGTTGPDGEAAEALEAAPQTWLPATGLILAGSVGLIVGSELLIDGAVSIAKSLGVSDAVIGLTLVAFGTSLPELATAVVAALRRHADVAIGNIIGSNIFNVLGILGVLALVTPFEFTQELLVFDIWVMLGATLLLMAILASGRAIGRGTALVFLAIYGIFIFVQFDPGLAAVVQSTTGR
ncbi:calcium/sodium antiporter [Algihabitans sp.]|uniref:calcium/sodium antiporter n=1 Tax=Algihabitans sp. TaxID=2821514 RepID=UPI003BAC3D5B